jgi:hypothetical protein
MPPPPRDDRGKGMVGEVGRCIYCGAHGPGVKLTKEHIVPFSLGSDAYLKDASCLPCAAITRDFETHVARNIYGHLRIHQGIGTRHLEQRPKRLPLTVSVNGETSEITLPIDKHPFFLILPVWHSPGFFRGEPPNSGFSGLWHLVYPRVPAKFRETMGLTDETLNVGPDKRRIDPAQFGRAVAKIAYCNAIKLYGIDSFKPLAIKDLILGKYSAISYFVGSTRDPPPAPDKRRPSKTEERMLRTRSISYTADGKTGYRFL